MVEHILPRFQAQIFISPFVCIQGDYSRILAAFIEIPLKTLTPKIALGVLEKPKGLTLDDPSTRMLDFNSHLRC